MLEIYQSREQFDGEAITRTAHERYSEDALGRVFSRVYANLMQTARRSAVQGEA